MSEKKCIICKTDLFKYNIEKITYDNKTLCVCNSCKFNFSKLISENCVDFNVGKEYFEKFDAGQYMLALDVKGCKIPYSYERDDFDARDIKNILKNIEKIDTKLVHYNNHSLEIEKIVNYMFADISDIKKMIKFFYYLVIIGLYLGGFILLFMFFGIF